MMNITEFAPLTEQSVAALLAGRDLHAPDDHIHPRRRAQRWPFPGTIELWVPTPQGIDEHSLATCLDLSVHGAGMLYDKDLPPALELDIAIHQPEQSLHGRAAIRHCTEIEHGYYIGMQFLY